MQQQCFHVTKNLPGTELVILQTHQMVRALLVSASYGVMGLSPSITESLYSTKVS